MPDQPQTQTLSLRISEALRKRLEHIRAVTALRKGESVSTSEVAKQLLESSPADRLELVELLQMPTEALARLRKKCDAQQLVSRAEWAALAYYVQQGAEGFGKTPVSREACIAILEAFQGVYELRKRANAGRDEYYLGNLPEEFQSGERKPSSEVVRQAVAGTLRRLNDPASKLRPVFAARNLYVFLEDEEITGVEALNRVILPYWEALWRMAARGHYFVNRRPIREEHPWGTALAVGPPLPHASEGKYALSFERGPGKLSLSLSFPGPRGPMYPMGPYPMISEFRAMLNSLTARNRSWSGEYFFGYVSSRGQENEFWFRGNGNNITFGFSEEEWNTIRKLFRRGWEAPEIQVAWEALAWEYGEL